MASPISISGLGSGLDTKAIIAALVSVERIPQQQMQSQADALQKKIDLLGTLRGKVSTLRDKANALGQPAAFLSFKVNASQAGIVSASASGAAQAGEHTLVAQQLATTDRWALDGVSDPDVDLATVNGQQVSFDYGGQTYSMRFNAGESSLNEIASGINTIATGKVAASVVNAGTAAAPSWQLVLTAKETGEDFRISNLASTVAGLTVDGTGPNAQGVAQSTNNISVGSNAVAVIDGLTVERTSNDFTGVIAGVSLSLLQGDPNTTVTLTVEPDKGAVKGKIKDFVDAYNEVVKYIRAQNTYDEKAGAGGPLFGETSLRTIQRTLNNAMFGWTTAQIAADTNGFGTPRLVGIESSADGTLKINDKVMDAKMDEDLAAFADLFVDSDGFDNGGVAVGDPAYYTDISADTGLGDDLARAIDQVVKSYGNSSGKFSKGIFDARVEALNSNIKTLNERIDARETHIAKYEEQLTARFSALESLMAQLQSQSSFLSQ